MPALTSTLRFINWPLFSRANLATPNNALWIKPFAGKVRTRIVEMPSRIRPPSVMTPAKSKTSNSPRSPSQRFFTAGMSSYAANAEATPSAAAADRLNLGMPCSSRVTCPIPPILVPARCSACCAFILSNPIAADAAHTAPKVPAVAVICQLLRWFGPKKCAADELARMPARADVKKFSRN